MSRRVWVKICGVTLRADAEAAVEAGADALGVNFVSSSKRRCDFAAAREIVSAVEGRVVVYGVFSRASRSQIERTIEKTGIGGLQFHGGEPDAELAGWGLPMLRAVAADSAERVARALARAAGYRVLLDSPAGGGSGTRFDDAAVAGQDLSGAVIAGGLDPANVASVVARLRPFGVDVAGGVESAPGVKDHRRLREFVENANSTS